MLFLHFWHNWLYKWHSVKMTIEQPLCKIRHQPTIRWYQNLLTANERYFLILFSQNKAEHSMKIYYWHERSSKNFEFHGKDYHVTFLIISKPAIHPCYFIKWWIRDFAWILNNEAFLWLLKILRNNLGFLYLTANRKGTEPNCTRGSEAESLNFNLLTLS